MPKKPLRCAIDRATPILLAAVLALQTVTVAWAEDMRDHGQHGETAHGGQLYGQVLVEQLELRWADGDEIAAWDAQAWYGGDYEKLRLKTEGTAARGHGVEEAEVQVLYSRLVDYFWDVQAGLRHDIRPRPSRSYGVLGLQGLAPGFIEIDLAAFVSERGDVSARLKAEYDILVTQRLILQPKAEINLAVQEVPELGIGQGFNDLELGLRLRYELTREFAPYLGVQWHRKFGETATFARREGDETDEVSLIAGIRFWF